MNTDLIKRCQLGDLNSYSELYWLYSKNALGTAYLISDRKGIAEDIVQEAFIQCFNKIKSLKIPETFEVWFYKILVRTGWRMVKKYNNFIPMDDENMEGLSIGINSGLDASETSIIVNEALESLSLPLRTVVILYYFNDMTIKEISEVLGCFQGTVKSRLHNARKQLYETLNENEQQEQTSNKIICKRKGYRVDGTNA